MDPQFGYHPLLTLNAGMEESRHTVDETANEVYGDVTNCPRTVAMLVLTALVGVVALKALGFQFAIGVGK